GGGRVYSMEKMWWALHFLLTGDAPGCGEPPLAWAVFGADEIGKDTGYGPPRFLTPEQVGAVSAALSALSRDELRVRFDPARFDEAEVYPGVWDEDPEELFDELMTYLDGLTDHYRSAAEAGDGMLLAIS